ncbi:S1 family peptidase [Actinoplanes bogorensis]|uniref:S1 family peptidase n=1 Tax=Paractinoplanes bogorensis TaxID=1610840 RepID=A0ABS5YWL3_9ACTN|nr:S1 family peptidase [Actinoplanes bogorensis]MBU2667099.1 S1 family peptidase [Actinoplanes bogorensis]
MRRRNLTGRVVMTAGLLIAGTALVPAPANAAAAVGVMSAVGAVSVADRLGDTRTGGAYIDSAGRAVVTVTDAAAAESVRAAGGTAQLVKYSTAQLKSVTTALGAEARIPGTSWGVDPSTNKVSVEIDSTVTGTRLAQMESVTKRYGDAVQVDRIGGKIDKAELFTSGGQGIQGPGTKCSLGFNVRTPPGKRYFLTAGHCSPSSWDKAADGTFLGQVVYRVWPRKDFALVEYQNSNVTAYGTVWVNGTQKQIDSSRNAIDGESVSRVGTISTDLVGQVLLTSTTVNYSSGGYVEGVIKTSNCARHGDSGGALFHGTVALGITSGGNYLDAGCSDAVSDRRSYYQPVQEVLNALGQSVY